MSSENETSLHDLVHHLSDEEWHDMVVRSLDEPVVDGIAMPGFPSEDVQQLTNSLAGRTTLEGGYAFYVHVRRVLQDHGRPLDSSSRILDYGCGWGRITRFFIRDVPAEQIAGCDVAPVLVDACRSVLSPCRFELIEPGRPLPYDDASFDLICANSVLSHLDESLHTETVAELSRVLTPGGIAILTVLTTTQLDVWKGHTGEYGDWVRSVLGDLDAVGERLERGEFVWGSTGRSGVLTGYGLALVGESWLRGHWPAELELLDLRRAKGVGQELAIGRRRSS